MVVPALDVWSHSGIVDSQRQRWTHCWVTRIDNIITKQHLGSPVSSSHGRGQCWAKLENWTENWILSQFFLGHLVLKLWGKCHAPNSQHNNLVDLFGPTLAEGATFYVGVFTVIAGLSFIVGMGFWSIYNPYKGEKFNRNNEPYQILPSPPVQICPEHEEIANGVLDYGPGYNGTILEDTLLMFKCDEGKN